MMDYFVSIEIQSEICDKVDIFNKRYLNKKSHGFCADVRGKFIYLLKIMPDGSLLRMGRLTYQKDLKDMDFAIFKHTKAKYVPLKKDFPGTEFLDGTIEGALKALHANI